MTISMIYGINPRTGQPNSVGANPTYVGDGQLKADCDRWEEQQRDAEEAHAANEVIKFNVECGSFKSEYSILLEDDPNAKATFLKHYTTDSKELSKTHTDLLKEALLNGYKGEDQFTPLLCILGEIHNANSLDDFITAQEKLDELFEDWADTKYRRLNNPLSN